MAERNPSKQRRAAQNKAQREALAARRVRSAESRERAVEDQARREAAPEAEPETDLAEDAEVDAAEETTSAGAARPRQRARYKPKAQKTESGRPSRSAPSKPAPSPTSRTAAAPAPKGRASAAKASAASSVPVAPTEPGWRGFIAHVQEVPGGKAVMFALIFSVVAAGTLLALKVVQQSAGVAAAHMVNPITPGKTPEKAYVSTGVTRGVTLTEAAGPLGLLFAAVPVFICSFALDATRRPNRRRAFTIAAFGLGIYVVFFSFIGIFYFFSMAGLFFAAYQARKADPPVRAPRPRRPAKGEAEES